MSSNYQESHEEDGSGAGRRGKWVKCKVTLKDRGGANVALRVTIHPYHDDNFYVEREWRTS